MRRIIILIMMTLSFSGCTPVELPKLEDLALVEAIGYDKAEDKLRITMAVPQHERGKTIETKVYQDIVDLSHEALVGVSKKSDKTVSYSQLRVVLIGEAFAKEEGIRNIMLQLYRDPQVGDNVFLAIVKGTAVDFLTIDDPKKMPISNYLNDMLRPRRQTSFSPFTTIHDFIFNMTDEVSDPIIPFIEKCNKDIEITKIALFKDDKMVDTIAPWEANMIYGLAGRKQISSVKVPLKEKTDDKQQYVMLEFVESKIKWKSNKSLDNPILDLEINLTADLYGYTGNKNLEDAKDLKDIENQINNHLKDNILQIIEKIKKLKIDPIRSGDNLRKYYKDWSKEMWREILPNVKYNVIVETEILNIGTLN